MSLFIYLGFSLISQCFGELEKKVVAGDSVSIRRHPHAVYLRMSQSDEAYHICGSSVLNQLFLLSVAHCFYGYEEDWKITAFAGHENIEMHGNMATSHNFSTLVSVTFMLIFSYENSLLGHHQLQSRSGFCFDRIKSKYTRDGRYPIIHGNYNPPNLMNDIALLLLKKRLPLGHDVKRIILTRSSPRSISATLAGWGIVNDITEENTIFLQSVVQRIRKRECRVLRNEPGTFCAGSLKPSDSRPSHGDSGSGLVDNNYRIIGLLSYKITAYPALPVYTNASYFYNWIQNEINRLCHNTYDLI